MSLNESEILGASILIVDDQRANVDLLEHLLGDAGYTRVSSTTDPREVCALHQQNRFDLILLDLQMPGMDGFEVMEGLKRLSPDDYLPVLVLTAQPSAKLKALQAGAKDFLSKPFDVLEVQTRIRNMLEVRLLYNKVEDHNRQLEQAVHDRTADLRESESRFRSLVELATDWYWEQDENGKFTKVSGPALEMLGMVEHGTDEEPEQLLWNEEERVQLGEKLAARLPFLDFVYSRIRPDGSEQVLQTSGEPKFDASGRFTGYRGIGSDVTGRMRAAGSRREQELQRFRNALDSTTHAIFLLDRTTMQFVDVNSTASKMFGYTRDELLSMGPEKLAADPGDYDEGHYDQLIAGVGGFDRRQAQLRRKDGSLILAEVHRQANRTEHGWLMAEVVRDMTSEK